MIRRRKFIMLLGGAAAWPLGLCGQQPATSVVGYLGLSAKPPTRSTASIFGTPLSAADDVAAFREGLSQAGYIEGRNLAIEFRFPQNLDQLPE
jgi:putative ABC transport system substrate-binding protein